MEVLAGQMLTGKTGEPLGHPVQFSILKFMNSYVLIVGFPTPLPQGVLDLIAFEASKQPNDGSLVDAIAIILGLSKDQAGLTVGNINSINLIGSINPANISKPENVNSSEQPPPGQ